MRKITLLALAFLSFSTLKAQIYYPDGTTITSTATFKDINNTTYDLLAMCNQGKHVIIDLSATWCSPCFSYHQSKVLDHYHDKFGPNGTQNNDAMVFLYEVDMATTMADLNGTTAASQGDWVTGTTHPICNESSTNSLVLKFVQPGQSYSIPAVFVVCSDKKLYKVSTSIITDANLRSFIASKCPLAPLSADEVYDINFSYSLSPNPSMDATEIGINLENVEAVKYQVRNMMGQVVAEQTSREMAAGKHSLRVETSELAAGLYTIQLQVGKRVVSMKMQVIH
jgi:thiol-disulfide isomerase/thioredoxin